MELDKVRFREHIGIVSNDTSTDKFSFLVSPLKNRPGIEKEAYVILNHPDFGDSCPALAIVKEIKSYEEVAGSTLTDKVGKMLATAEIVGYVDLRSNLRDGVRPMHALLVPPNPGSRVYMPYVEFLEDTFSRNADGRAFKHALHIGKTESFATTMKENVRPIDFYLDAEDFTTKHSLIAAVEGAGKTSLAAVIVEELATKTGHPTVVLDPFGEYNTVGTHGKDPENWEENEDPPSKQHPVNLSVTILTTQLEEVTKSLEKNRKALLENRKISIRSIPSQWCSPPNEKAERETKETIAKNVKANQVTVINPAGLEPQGKRNLFDYCLSALWKSRLTQSIEPFFVVIEDAETIARDLLEILAHEGGKIGVSLCLLTTYPTELGGKVMSYTGNQLLGKTTDRDDLEYLKNMALEKSDLLPKLKPGEWIINGMSQKQPTKVFARQRHSLPMQTD
jgi:DNA helicase HerA-like ATPase